MKRTVFLDAHDVGVMDEAVQALFRQEENVYAVALGAVALRIREQMSPTHFACDVDESAGMAEVVELRSYSKKAPCA